VRERTAPDTSLAAVSAWVDARFGLLGEVHCSRLGHPEPGWWYCGGSLARYPVGNRFSLDPASSAGTSTDREEALWRAMGEGIERYSALNAAIDGVPLTLRATGLAERLPVCAPDEPCAPSLRALPLDVPLTHVAVQRLADGREVSIPAGFVHLNFHPAPPEPLVTLPISTGLAFHTDLPTAIWSGLCEVAERDAVMAMWWRRTSLPEIVCTGAAVPDSVVDRLERLTHAGLHARLFDMTTDFRVPSVFGILLGERYPLVVVSAACRSDPADACTKTLDELVAMRLAMRGRREAVPATLQRLEDHALLYAHRGPGPAFDFLLDHDVHAQISFAEFAGQSWWERPADMAALATCAGHLAERGLTVLWTDVTAEEAAGIGTVAKVIVPEMIPLSSDDAIRWLGTPRLLAQAGMTTARASHFNPFPHPFA
jgi:ribosomal protein S12 methylthiotransferase accessory factor